MKYLPILSRLLIVGTFYEDALRTFWQWEDQAFYLQRVRHIPKTVTFIFLAVNLFVCASYMYTHVYFV